MQVGRGMDAIGVFALVFAVSLALFAVMFLVALRRGDIG